MFDLKHIWKEMWWPNKAITVFILMMAVLAISVTIERMIALSKSAKLSREFASKAERAIETWDTDNLLVVAGQYKLSSLARLFGSIIAKYHSVLGRGDVTAAGLEMIKNESARQQEALGTDIRRGMSILATIGSITPFVGLLGTVIGIIAAFQKIGQENAGGIGTVSTQIGEALIETALGLAVAIPAVICFNYLTGRVGAVEAALGRSAGQLLDEMEFRHADTHERNSDVETRQAA
ncbi:MAG: MotA/TolQ/ExbB proton channel family protein [Polyangiaceae bacterium]|nr:MotA/TolQ/ExbB proton channel family protein [Polyangiaceae bacterium]